MMHLACTSGPTTESVVHQQLIFKKNSMNTAEPGDHNEEGKQAKGGGFPYLKVIGGTILLTIVAVFGVRSVWGFFFPSPSKDTANTPNTAAFEQTVRGWVESAEKKINARISELDQKVDTTSIEASTALKRELEGVKKEIGTIRADTSSLKEEQGKLAKTGLEHEKALGVLTANLKTLTEQVAALKAVPQQPVVANVVPQPAVSLAPVAVVSTGLPLSNQAISNGPGPQRFLVDASASDQSVADGLDRIANQTKDRVAQSTLATAARALRGGLKVDPDVRLKLRIIAQGMSARRDLAQDAGLVNDAYRALQP